MRGDISSVIISLLLLSVPKVLATFSLLDLLFPASSLDLVLSNPIRSSMAVDWEAVISWTIVACLFPIFFLIERRIPRSGGLNWKYHVLFFLVTGVAVYFIPPDIKFGLFSPLGITVIGSLFPIYESIRAVCTPQGEDDKAWLQYWITYSFLRFCTEWVDDVKFSTLQRREMWYDFNFFLLVWLILPWTDGANLVFEYVTKPLTASWVSQAEQKMSGLINNLIQTVTTVTHLWLVWAIFLFFPANLKRFITVCIGVVYPWTSSVVAVNTSNTFDDDTQWLTYWSCYGILYLIMVFLETWLGRIPGFYTLVIFATVYLMLPITNGAEKVFRNILVPLAGLRDLLMVRDALVIKKQMLDSLTPAQRKAVKEAIASSFAANDDFDEANDPLIRYGQNLGGATGTSSTTGAKADETTPTETTPLV